MYSESASLCSAGSPWLVALRTGAEPMCSFQNVFSIEYTGSLHKIDDHPCLVLGQILWEFQQQNSLQDISLPDVLIQQENPFVSMLL